MNLECFPIFLKEQDFLDVEKIIEETKLTEIFIKQTFGKCDNELVYKIILSIIEMDENKFLDDFAINNNKQKNYYKFVLALFSLTDVFNMPEKYKYIKELNSGRRGKKLIQKFLNNRKSGIFSYDLLNPDNLDLFVLYWILSCDRYMNIINNEILNNPDIINNIFTMILDIKQYQTHGYDINLFRKTAIFRIFKILDTEKIFSIIENLELEILEKLIFEFVLLGIQIPDKFKSKHRTLLDVFSFIPEKDYSVGLEQIYPITIKESELNRINEKIITEFRYENFLIETFFKQNLFNSNFDNVFKLIKGIRFSFDSVFDTLLYGRYREINGSNQQSIISAFCSLSIPHSNNYKYNSLSEYVNNHDIQYLLKVNNFDNVKQHVKNVNISEDDSYIFSPVYLLNLINNFVLSQDVFINKVNEIIKNKIINEKDYFLFLSLFPDTKTYLETMKDSFSESVSLNEDKKESERKIAKKRIEFKSVFKNNTYRIVEILGIQKIFEIIKYLKKIKIEDPDSQLSESFLELNIIRKIIDIGIPIPPEYKEYEIDVMFKYWGVHYYNYIRVKFQNDCIFPINYFIWECYEGECDLIHTPINNQDECVINTKNFIIIPLSLRKKNVYVGHQNMLIYDKHNKILERFEPNQNFDEYHTKKIKYKIIDFFKKITHIHDNIKYIDSSEDGNMCWLGPQYYENKQYENQNDEKYNPNEEELILSGTCQVWSFIYAYLRLYWPDKGIEEIKDYIHETISTENPYKIVKNVIYLFVNINTRINRGENPEYVYKSSKDIIELLP